MQVEMLTVGEGSEMSYRVALTEHLRGGPTMCSVEVSIEDFATNSPNSFF